MRRHSLLSPVNARPLPPPLPCPPLPRRPTLCDFVVHALCPATPPQASTLALRELVKRYNMAAFHQTTQRLAIGTMAGIVILYDLRTATKWRILQGHGGPVVAVAFAAGGDLVASFSAADLTLRWWQAGSSSLLGYFGLHGHCHKVVKVELPDEPAPEGSSGGTLDCALMPPLGQAGGAAPGQAGGAPACVAAQPSPAGKPGAQAVTGMSARGVGMRLEWTSPSTVMLLGRTGKPLGFYTL